MPEISKNNSLEGADIWGDGPEKDGIDPCRSRNSSRPPSRSSIKVSLTGKKQDKDVILGDEAAHMTTAELRQLCSLLHNDIRIMQSDMHLISYEAADQRKNIKAAEDRIAQNSQPPLLVSNVVEILDPREFKDETMHEYDAEEEGAARDFGETMRDQPSAVIKTSTRQTIFLPIPGLIDPRELRPADLVGCNTDTYLILEKLPDEHDQRVKAMEITDKPTESYADIAGCDAQIQELIEAVVLPMTHNDMFKAVGITPPKGVLLYGPPGTGKTLLARACAAQTNAIFLKLAGPELVQMYIGDGSKMVRDAFQLAKEKFNDGDTAGVIIFIDELDAIGTKREGGDRSGEREVQRTLCELLNQLDGFTSNDMIKVIAATNRCVFKYFHCIFSLVHLQ